MVVVVTCTARDPTGHGLTAHANQYVPVLATPTKQEWPSQPPSSPSEHDQRKPNHESRFHHPAPPKRHPRPMCLRAEACIYRLKQMRALADFAALQMYDKAIGRFMKVHTGQKHL